MPEINASTSWEIAPHTAAKLEILGTYLRAWFPILSRAQKFDRIIYIDGFAGPGRYSGGEDGSPIVALKAALGAFSARPGIPCEFHFVEQKPRITAELKVNIENFLKKRIIPTNWQILIHEVTKFEDAYINHIRPRLLQHPFAPAFALVDPFGWTGFPISILVDLVGRSSTEIFVNFMFEEINRFLSYPKQISNFDLLFGCSEWRQAYDLGGRERKKFIHDLYRDQMHSFAKARYVRSFEMKNERNLSDYFLYFVSNNRLGLSRMKEAMWKVDRSGGFTFSDATDFDQTVLFLPEPDRFALRRLLQNRFLTKSVTVKQIENFVVEDTPFLATHYRKVLASMEADGQLTLINPSPSRRRGTYPDANLLLQFN